MKSAFFALLAIFAGERVAHACSPNACTYGYSAPSEGKTLPSNAPALYVASDPFSTIVLRTPDGLGIEHTREGTLLRPSAPLPIGDAIVEFGAGCLGPQSIRFHVAAAAPLPEKLGTVAIANAREQVKVAASGTCTEMIDAAVAHLSITLDAATEPYRSVLAFETKVDGEAWATSTYGLASRPVGTYEMAAGARRHDTLFARCAAQSLGDGGLTQGVHRVTVTGLIAGAAPLPPVAFDVELRCEKSVFQPDAQAEEPAGSCALGTRSSGTAATLSFALLLLLGRALDTHRRSR